MRAIGAVLMAASLAVPGPVPAQETPSTGEPATVRTAGAGEVRIEPDRVVVVVSLQSRAATAAAALDSAGARQEAVLGTLARFEIPADSVETTGLRAWPVWSPEPDPEVRAYQVDASLRFSTRDLTRVGELLDAALEAGASGIGGLSFESEREDEARAEALRLAVEHARREAEALASAAGARLGGLVELDAAESPFFPRAELAMDAAERGAGARFEVRPQPVIVSARVEGVWRLGTP